jgi:uncharacterized SAM-binding protein YcdF (DUF218 family)
MTITKKNQQYMSVDSVKLILALSGLFLLFLFLNSCSFSAKASKRLLKESRVKGYDIIIVPGVPLEKGKWSKTMKARIYWSKYLFDEGIAKNIIYSGSSVYSPYYEGDIMALYAVAIGIPAKHVFSETKAEHSTENLYYSYKKAKKLGFKSIALASDPFQTKSLRRYARLKVNAEVGLIPMVKDTMTLMEPAMTDPVIDYQQAFNKDFIRLKKRENFWKRLRGTMGKNVDVNAYE